MKINDYLRGIITNDQVNQKIVIDFDQLKPIEEMGSSLLSQDNKFVLGLISAEKQQKKLEENLNQLRQQVRGTRNIQDVKEAGAVGTAIGMTFILDNILPDITDALEEGEVPYIIVDRQQGIGSFRVVNGIDGLLNDPLVLENINPDLRSNNDKIQFLRNIPNRTVMGRLDIQKISQNTKFRDFSNSLKSILNPQQREELVRVAKFRDQQRENIQRETQKERDVRLSARKQVLKKADRTTLRRKDLQARDIILLKEDAELLGISLTSTRKGVTSPKSKNKLVQEIWNLIPKKKPIFVSTGRPGQRKKRG